MEYQINTQENWSTIINVTVPAGKIQPLLDKKYQDLQKSLKIEGFRQGKVPPQLIKKMYGKQVEYEVFEPFFSEAWKKVFAENEFHTISEPRLDGVKYDTVSGLNFNIVFDVRPELDIIGQRDLAVEKIIFQITDEDVDSALENLRQRSAMIYTVDGAAQEGHFLVADLQELDRTGVPVIGKKYLDQQLWLTQQNEELLRQLAGISAGERRRLAVTIQETQSELIQKPEQTHTPTERLFDVTVKEVKERKVPDLDDEFAKDVGPFKSLQELRQAIENDLKNQADGETRYRFRRALADELIKKNPFEVPPTMFQNYLQAIVRDYQARMGKATKMSDEQLSELFKADAVRSIKWLLISQRLFDVEHVEVSDELVAARIEELEKSGPKGAARADELRNDEDKKSDFIDKIKEEKLYDLLAQNARITEIIKPWHRVEEHDHDHDHELTEEDERTI